MPICTSPVTSLKDILAERQAAILQIAAIKVSIRALSTLSTGSVYLLITDLRIQLSNQVAKLINLNLRLDDYLIALDPNQITPLPLPAPANSTITLLTKYTNINNSEIWYYCAVSRLNLDAFDYGWASASEVPAPTTILPALNNFTITSFSVMNGLLSFINPG